MLGELGGTRRKQSQPGSAAARGPTRNVTVTVDVTFQLYRQNRSEQNTRTDPARGCLAIRLWLRQKFHQMRHVSEGTLEK
jgi:hypothetical protein